jgi:hypothetical protein
MRRVLQILVCTCIFLFLGAGANAQQTAENSEFQSACSTEILPSAEQGNSYQLISPHIWRLRDLPRTGSRANWLRIGVNFRGGTTAHRNIVKKFANEWPVFAGIAVEWVFDEPAMNQILVEFSSDRNSHSELGTLALTKTRAGKASMKLAVSPALSERWNRHLVLHEFGHALGLMHEHQHPDARIPWDINKILNKQAKKPGARLTVVSSVETPASIEYGSI